MNTNVIAFAARATTRQRRARRPAVQARDNVIELAGWIGRALPRRTPNGVFYATPGCPTPDLLA